MDIDNFKVYDLPESITAAGLPMKAEYDAQDFKDEAGMIGPHCGDGTIEEITQGRKEAVLMDNNFLAAPEDFVSEQLQKIAREKIAVDFNQALDARLVTPKNARLLAACKWIRFIRFACDTSAQIEPVKRAVSLIRESGNRKFSFSVYLLIQEIADAEKRLREMVKKDFAAFANVKGGKLCLKMKFSQYQHGSI